MNAKSTQLTPRINQWLKGATLQLKNLGIKSASLDCELILAHILRASREYLIAHGDDSMKFYQFLIAELMLKKRKKMTPIAYILRQKEFFGRKFFVNKNTLIPRPESEAIIEILKDSVKKSKQNISSIKLIDVGTGSGCLGITAKLEIPEITVTLTDISSKALKVASKNAKNLLANVNIKKSNLLQSVDFQPNIILANLPYVNRTWQTSPETAYEPSTALFADDEGKSLIKKLLNQASVMQSKDDLIIFEADPEQHIDLIEYAKTLNYKYVTKSDFAVLIVHG